MNLGTSTAFFTGILPSGPLDSTAKDFGIGVSNFEFRAPAGVEALGLLGQTLAWSCIGVMMVFEILLRRLRLIAGID